MHLKNKDLLSSIKSSKSRRLKMLKWSKILKTFKKKIRTVKKFTNYKMVTNFKNGKLIFCFKSR